MNIADDLLRKIQSVDGAYVVASNPGWRIRVQAMALPLVDGFGTPVVASVVVSMVFPEQRRDAGLPTAVPEKYKGNEAIVFHYQLMKEREHIQEFADAIVDHLEEQFWSSFRRGTRAVLSMAPTERKAGAKRPASSGANGGKNTAPMENHFTIGSTIKDVLHIQGTPTAIIGSGQIYMWGPSTVTFVDGRVSEYSNVGGNLRVRSPETK